MAIYHLTTKIVARSKGHSAVAAAAYRARMEITNERTGEVWNYSRKSGDVLFTGIYLPKDAPEWMQDRAQLWNAVEFSEKRKDAQVARDFIIGLPHELTEEQQRYALQDWVRENFVRKGYVADVAIHRPGEEGDQRNTHAHVLVTMRSVEGGQFAAKKERSADRLADLEQWRESWEKIGNRHLTRHGHTATLDRRSLDAQGIDRLPQIHIGKDATEMERKGIQTDRGDTMHEIQSENLARDLKKKFGHKVTGHELERPAVTAPEMKMEPLDQPKVTEPESPWEGREPPPRAPKGQGILATIWSLARTSGAAIAGMIFGSSRSVPTLPQESEPFRNDDGLLAAQEPSGKAQEGQEAGLGPKQGGDALERLEELTDAAMTDKTAPPPLTRELTMVEKLQDRGKRQLAEELARPTREQQRQIKRDLDLDL